jgi:hypothetical protein
VRLFQLVKVGHDISALLLSCLEALLVRNHSLAHLRIPYETHIARILQLSHGQPRELHNHKPVGVLETVRIQVSAPGVIVARLGQKPECRVQAGEEMGVAVNG